MAEYEPLIGGLRIGCLVEVHDLKDDDDLLNGQFGQIVSCAGDKFCVYLVSGQSRYLGPENLKVPDCKKPGEGGDRNSFDMLIGPQTNDNILAEEISLCLFEKGFCVLKICQSTAMIEPTLDMLRQMGDDGKLERLPEEVEEGYLGVNCQAKVAWLNPDDRELSEDEALMRNDANLTFLAQIFQPYSDDVLGGKVVEERTPALVALTLTEDEEPEYPFPVADDKVLGAFLTTWRRGLVRAVHFLGPGAPSVTLDKKEVDASKKSAKVPKGPQSISLDAESGTILLFRPEVYNYTCASSEESLMLITNFLAEQPSFIMGDMEGDITFLNAAAEGPPPPSSANHVNVMCVGCRNAANNDAGEQGLALLTAGTDEIVEVPITRWDVNVYWTSDEVNFAGWQTTTKHQSYVEGVDLFDNKYFEISAMEARAMDPVQRLVLEAGCSCTAQIGLTKKVANKQSTHAGFSVGNDKLDWNQVPKCEEVGAGGQNVLAIIANRFSFVFNMKGPNFVADTACSASLSSTHLAKLALMEREYDPLEWHCSMGAHLVLSPLPFVGCSQSHMSSPKGRCFTFNASADGYLRGEGVCGIILKWGNLPEERVAILRATALGQDGRSASLTAPNGPAQEEMILRAFKEAKMTPPESTVWECHGTGTSLGDPIEVGAVRKVQIRMPRKEPLMVRSTKANGGHLEGGAAMKGCIAAIKMVGFSKCMATQHVRTLNPHLEHTNFDCLFETEVAPFCYMQGHSQVSSFGFGGSNAHGIFWGCNHSDPPPANRLFMQKVKSCPPPEVRPVGTNPDDWEADYPDKDMKVGDVYALNFHPDDPKDKPLEWVKEADAADVPDDDDTQWAITGNFNDWTDERMAQGEVEGQHVSIVEMPSSGRLEFRFLRNETEDEVLAPEYPECTRKLAAMEGPKPGLTNFWVVEGVPGQEIEVSLMAVRGRYNLMWVKDPK
eukprot:gnl/TRDRNA2_/TRDRNA2_177407_c0_seq1.p1 gnl/TRDRNA2_/TRDRNA2_177407_c0~~gnl/TRDRNA2_/TRDRNA2_177407_c0_seq1.p1  ORF type:complete len:948 (+),score=187.45 gnl/TRDRNA2_/TRDRNA2_177407_c0_seq1:82-2925(+)